MEVITTQREFEALEKEISDADALEQSLLKQLHAKERQFNDLVAIKSSDEETLVALDAEVSAETSKIDAILKDKQAELTRLEETCKASIDEDITPQLYTKFASIVRNKEDNGIVPIHNNVCCGCHMVLPVQFVNDVRSMHDIEFCPYCSRILYYEEVEEVETQGLDAFTSEEDFDDIL
jgi:predicted  nucleic acid-binding Zn-ribbon protein